MKSAEFCSTFLPDRDTFAKLHKDDKVHCEGVVCQLFGQPVFLTEIRSQRMERTTARAWFVSSLVSLSSHRDTFVKLHKDDEDHCEGAVCLLRGQPVQSTPETHQFICLHSQTSTYFSGQQDLLRGPFGAFSFANIYKVHHIHYEGNAFSCVTHM